MSPVILAGLLYIGAFLGLSVYYVFRGSISESNEVRAGLETKDWIWLLGAVLSGGIIAPISLMFGLKVTSGFSASLLLNLEGVATAVIAVWLFKENAGGRLWLALACMTASGVFLSWDPISGEFKMLGPILIVIAMVCWGLDNNLTRHISDKDPIQIATIKGIFSGAASLSIAYLTGKTIPLNVNAIFALVLGAFSYGVSLVFFIKALKMLGSFRTGIFFSLAPFIGALTSLILLREWIGWVMFPAAGLMAAGYWLIIGEKHFHAHSHELITHAHLHDHRELHHRHVHSGNFKEPHIHEHTHEEETHAHAHWPDSHHRHLHR
jgi:drug/metabolite transporter (DMT)-like permease